MVSVSAKKVKKKCHACIPLTLIIAGSVGVHPAVLHQPGHILAGEIQAGEEEGPAGLFHAAWLQGLLQTGKTSENVVCALHFRVELFFLLKCRICTEGHNTYIKVQTVRINVRLKGLSHEIDFKTFDKNLQNFT
jgi:hypothetical protein